MIPERFGDAETDLFNRLWAGAEFDIINAVLKECPGWDRQAQQAMMIMIVSQIARRWAVVFDDEDDDEMEEEET